MDRPDASHKFPGQCQMVRKHDPKAAHLRVRIDGKLLRQIEKAALQNDQSVNSEVVDRLERSFAKEEALQAAKLAMEKAQKHCDLALAAVAEAQELNTKL